MSVRSSPSGLRRSRLFTTSAFGALALAVLWAAPAHAQLVQTGASGNGGAPVVDQSVPNTTTVTLTGSRTVIDWSQFDINSGERADFIFANRSDIVLNRVGGAASTINGDLNGMVGAGGPTSGNIWIYNANGVVIGANARINTGGLLVTTAALDRADDSSAGGFLDGSSTSFGFTGSATGSGIAVQNGAQINSYGGAIALVAPVVTTEAGSAVAAQDGGNVLYGAASKYKISFRPTGTDDLDLIGFEVAGSADGTGETGGITMGGATSGNRVFAAVVSKTGVIADIVGTGAVTATNVAMDETGAIVLLGNHNLVNGAAGGMVANAGTSDIKLHSGGTLTAPAVSLVTSDSINTNHTTTVSALGGTIDLLAKNGAIFGTGRFNTGTFTAESYGTLWLNGTNNIGTLGGLRNTTNDLVFVGNGNLNIAGDIVSSGEANVSVNGVASGSGLIRAPRAVVSGGGTFNLDSAATLRYVSAYAGNLTVNSNGNLLIDLSGAANDYGHMVTLNAASGGIRQTSGDALVGGVIANARDAIDLGALNQFTDITANSTGGGDIHLRASNALAFAGSTTGGMSVDAGGLVTVGGLLEAGTLNIVAGGDIDLNRSVLDIGSYNSLISSGNISVTTDSTISIGGGVIAGVGKDVSLTSNTGAINQTAGMISGRQLHLQANGSIVQDSTARMVGFGMVTNSVTAGGDVILAGSNQIDSSGPATLGWGAGRDVTYRSAGNIFFEGGGVAIGALNLIVDSGTIQQGGAFTANSFSASASGDILLNNASNNVAVIGGLSSTNGGILYRDANGFDIAGNITATNGGTSLRTSGAGSITQSAGIIDVDYLGVLTTGNSSVALNQANRIRRLIATSGSGTLSINSTTDLLIDQNVYYDTISLSSGGAITQSDTGTIAADTVNLSAITGINLPGAAFVGNNSIQNFGTISNTTSGGINIVSYSGSHTSLTGNISAAGQTVSITDVAGYILQTGGVITADTLTMSATGGINVGGNNQVANLGAMTGPGVTFANAGSFNVTQSISVSAGIFLTSNSGAITQSAGTTLTADTIALGAATTISQGAGATLRSTNLSLTSGGTTTLGEANDFTTLTDLAVGGDLTLRNLGNINLSPILGGTGGYRSGGALTLISDTGNILTTNSGIDTSRLNASAAGSISLDGTIASLGTITAGQSILLTTYNGSMDLTGNVTGRNISLYAFIGLSQSGGIIDAERLNVITNGDISLAGANQIDVVGRLDTDQFDSGAGHDITLRNVGAIVLDYQVEAPDGTVTLISDTGAISQTSFSNLFKAGTLKADAAGDIVLDQAGNDIDHLGTTRSQSGEVTFVDADAFDLTGQVRAAGALLLGAGGAITSNGGLIVAGDRLTVNAASANLVAGGNITLGTITTSGNFAIDTDQDIIVAGTIDTQGNTTTLTAGLGAIRQSGSGNILNGSAVATALNGINFGGDNHLTSFSGGSTGGGNIVFNDGGSGGIVVGLNTTGSATVTAGGNISSSGITVDSLSMEAGHIDLTNSVDVNSFTRLVAAYGDILVTNAGGFTIAGDVTTNKPGLRTIDLRANGGGISQTAGTVSGHYASLRGTGDLIQSGTARIDSNAAYFSGVNVLLGGANSLVSNDTDIAATGNLTLRNAGAIDLTAMGGYTAGGVLTLTSDTGSITATDAITASALTAMAANGAVTFNHADNLIPEIRGLSAATNATIVSRNGGFALTGDIDIGGTLALRAGTGINQAGGRIKAATLDAQLYQTMTTGSVLLDGANDVDNLYVLAGSGGGDVLFRDTDGFRVTYAVVGNRVTLTSDAGAITEAGGFIDGIQANQLTVSAVDGISLNNQWNGIRTILGLTNTGSGGIDVGGRGVNMVLDGNVTAAGQAVSLTALNASLTQTSGSITADTLNASAGTGIVLDKANSIARLGTLTNATSGGIRINDTTGDLDLAGTVTAAGQAVRFDTAGRFTQSAALGAYSTLTINAGTGLYLDQANNFGATTLSLSTGSGDITVRNVGNLTVSALTTADGTIRLISDTGTIGQTGLLTANTLFAEARREISLGGNNVITNVGGLVNTTGTITFRDVDGFNITGDIRGSTTTGERVNLIAGGMGDIVQTGGAIVVDKLRATAGGNLTLDGSANAFINVEVLSAGGDIRLRAQDSFVLGHTVDAGGTATLTSTNGFIGTDLGSIGHVRADALYVNAATGIDINLPGNITPKVSLVTAAGNIRYTTQGALEFLALSTPDRAIVSADALTQSGAIDVGELDALAGAIQFDMAGNRIGSLYAAMATGGDLVIADEDGFDIAGNLYASGAISLTAGGTGSITQSGGVITAPTVSLVAGGDITLDRANVAGVYNARSAIGGTITLRNAGDLTVNAITAQDGTVNLTSNIGSVGQLLVPGNSIWAGKLNVNAATDIDLAAQNITGLLGNLTAGGSIRYNSFGTLGLDGDIRAGGGVTFGISGYLGQYSGTITASHLDVTASGIALIGANDIGSAAASTFSATDDITVRSINSILLGSVSTPGLLSLTSDGGDIGQTAAFSAGRFDAIAAGDIVLDQLNTLDTVYDVTAGGVFSLRTTGALELDGRIAADDRVTFNTGGGLTQIGNTVIVTDRLEATAGTATATGIRLLGHNRVGAVSFDAGGNDIRFRNTGNIAINAINSPTGTVELISNLGKITQQASGGLVAGSLILNAANGVELYNSDNQIARLDVISRGNVSILTGGSGWGGLLTVDRIDAAGQAVSVANYVAGTTGGNITAASLTVFSAGDTNLGTTNNVAGNVALSGQNIAFTNLGNLVIDRVLSSNGNAVLRSEEGAISQTSSALVDTTGLTAYGRGGVQLAGGVRRIDGLSAGAGADVEVVSSRALELAGDISARNVLLRSNASPDVFTPTGGAITQTGGTITANLFRSSAYGAIDLGRSNQIAALGDVWSFTSGISVTSDRALDLTGALTATNGSVVLNADSITQTGGYIEAAALNARTSGALTLDQENRIAATGIVALNAGQDISFRNGGGFVLGMVDTAGAATLTSLNGSITQAASTRIAAGGLTVGAANGGITLDEANLIDTLGGLTAGDDLIFRNAGDFALDGDIAAAGHEVTLRSNTGAISQTSGTITALGLSAQAGGAITLGGANSVTNLRGVTAGGDFLYRNAGALTLGGTISSLGNMDMDAAGDIGGAASIDSRQSVRVASGGSIDLQSVSGRDDILIDAGGDARVRELFHLTGAGDAAGNGYVVDMLGNNVTLGAGSSAGVSASNRLRVDTNAIVSLGARAGDATLNLATMDHGVSIAATGDVRAFAIDDLNLVNVSGTNVSLSTTMGGVGADRVDVAGNYTLNAPTFYRNALQPLGARAGTWTLATSGDLDALGRTLEFGGGIDFMVGGTLSNGTVRSLNGSVAITAGIVDLYQISAATGIDATANAGDLGLFSADAAADDLRLTGGAVRVTGSLEAGSDIAVLATTGDAVIGYATAGRNIGISALGDATLRQANLTGATGDLTIGAGGSATLGDGDAASGIGTDRWFERAAGSTGAATITGGTGTFVNLDHSAKLDNVSAGLVEINVATGDLAIGQLAATSHGARVDVANGALTIGGASAAHGGLDLYADGDLTLLSHAGALDIYLTAGGLLDTRAAPVNGTDYVELTGGEIRAGTIGSGGDIDVFSMSGAIAVDSVDSTGGNAILNAFTDLNVGRVVASGGQLQAGGNATVRAITAPDGFALLALGNITLGADTAALTASDNLLVTGGSLGGCACGSGGATLISLGGDVRVNLQSATGVFDTIAAAVDGDANVHIATGDLGIGDLAAHNIAVTLPDGTLTVMNAVSSGGDYMLTARHFGGNALLPVFGGGATRLNNVTITDTEGDLAASGSLLAAGNIRVSSAGNLTGTLSLLADGDVDVTARAIRLDNVTGRDVVLDASAGGVDVVGTVTVGRDYTLSGTDFSANALAAGGARLGDLLMTDTAGDFAYGTLDLGFAGTATIRANGGAIRGGDIATLGDLDLSGAGVVAGTLRSDQGGVRVDSSAGVDLAAIRANNAIDANADGDLRLGNAALTGAGVNSFALAAGGDLLFGAADAASIGSGNTFTSAGSSMTGGGLRADGAILVNLDRAAELTGINGGILELTVRNGDLSIGNILTVGALFVTGPGGTLSIGDIETSAGHIGIAGQGNVTTGAVSGHFVVDIGSSAGSVAFRKVTGGDVTLAAASGITAVGLDAGVFADSLSLSAGGNVDLATNGTGSRIGRLRAITVANGDFALRDLQSLVLDGAIDVRDGTLNLQLAGALSQSSGTIVAQHLVGNIAGSAQLSGANSIAWLGDFTADGLLVNNATALGIDGFVDGGSGSVAIRAHGGMTIGAAGEIRSASNGDAIILASDGLFRNLAGGTALAAANGRWLVYTQALGNSGASDPANAFGGLAGRSFYGAAYDFATGGFGGAPSAGNRFVYGYRPVLTVRPSDLAITYNGQIPVLGAGITGLVNGDSAADAWSGAAHLSGAGRNAGAYTIAASLGSLASDMNYDFAFGTGTLRIDPRAITATLAANGKIYDGTTSATGSLLLGGVIAGDDVTVTGALGFADKNAGAGKMVTANGIALNGADAGNYTVNLTATSLADILARTITATLTANGKTYDGMAAATGTLSLGGVLAGDDVGVSGALAFADKNAGIGKTVTASGIALSGADAGNYVVDTTTTGLADILARTITATLAANGKTYDGTTAATGTLLLGGVLAGDMVNATGSYSFVDKNAGTGKTVSASGIALGGADAGNYIVNATATDVADILARVITATLAANGKTYDGTTGATGTLSLGGVVAGDDVAVSGSYAFADKNAGSGKTVTASGIALGGADAGNYVVNTTATGLADILARAITATLVANGKVYDGTAAATGTLSLGGILAGDQVGVTGGIAFDSRNAGERIVTVSGLTLNGADAGNYIVNASATDIATIARLGITGKAVADSRIYDGTVATTGRITLDGVLAGDAVLVAADYAFADPNAGVGRIVSVNGLALTGADAGNYAVTLDPGPVLADVLLRPVTVAADDLAKIFGMRDPALGWRVTGGSLVGSDAFTGMLERTPGEQVGIYAIGQGSLALSSNYALTFVPGTFAIRLTQSGADASDALRRRRPSSSFSLYEDPSANLKSDPGDE